MREDREFRLDEISPRAIGKDIIRNLWVILALVLAAALAVLGAEKLLYVPRYTSSAILAVNTTSNSSAYSSLSLTSQMAGVISEIFGSEVLQNRICEQMGVDQIDGEISAAVMEDTNLIRLEVTSSNPRQAYLIISSAMDNYNSVSDYLFDILYTTKTMPITIVLNNFEGSLEYINKSAAISFIILFTNIIMFISNAIMKKSDYKHFI